MALLSLYPLYTCTMYENLGLPAPRCRRPFHLFTTCLYATRMLAVKCFAKTQQASVSDLHTIPLNESSCAKTVLKPVLVYL